MVKDGWLHGGRRTVSRRKRTTDRHKTVNLSFSNCLDWSSLVPATIIPHKGEGLSVAFHELDAPTEELSSAPTNFLEYVDTLPEVSPRLLSFLGASVL
jgi:hypothetical protein